MGLFRPDRDRRGEDPALDHKMLVFMLGAVLALVGMTSGNRVIVYLAIAVLLVGVVLRFLHRRR